MRPQLAVLIAVAAFAPSTVLAEPAPLSECGLTPSSCRCGYPSCDCEWVIGPDLPLPPLHGHPNPDDPVPGRRHRVCVPSCEDSGECGPDWFPPEDHDVGACTVGDLSSEAIPPPVCDPRTCDFAFDQIPATPQTDPWGNPIGPEEGVQLVPTQCLYAGGDTSNEFLDHCFGITGAHDEFAFAEALVRRWGSHSDQACALLPGTLVECQHGTYCEETGGKMNPCVVCEGAAGCYRAWRRNDGLASDGTGEPSKAPVWWGCAHPDRVVDGESCTIGEPPVDDLRKTVDVVAPTDPVVASRSPVPPTIDVTAGGTPPTTTTTPTGAGGGTGRPVTNEGGQGGGDPSCANHMRAAIDWITDPPAQATTPGPAVQDPVDVGSGQLVDSYVDLEAPGRQGLDGLHFRFERFYSSGAISQGVLGRNWWHAYEERIVPVDEYFLDAVALPAYCTAALPIVRCAAREFSVGRYEVYVQDPRTLVFEPPPGGDQILVHIPAPADGYTSWQTRSADGTVKGFDTRGHLRWIRDRRRDEMHFVYNADGRLSTVIDPFQREYRFEYFDDDGVVPPDAQYGMLARVIDFAGREVRFTYDTVTLDPGGIVRQSNLFDRGLPGLLPRHHRLTAVELRGPAGESERWQYGYLSYDDARASVGDAPPLGIVDEANEVCGPVESGLAARVEWELEMGRLLGNLTTIHDPTLRLVLDSTYETDRNAPAFDRVISQTHGDGADDPATAASFLYVESIDGVPWRVLAAGPFTGNVHAGACAEAAQRHFGHVLFPGNAPGGPLGLSIWGMAAIDAASVCAFTEVIDRRGVETWYAVNYMGQPLVEATRAGVEWVITTRSYDPFGHLTMVRYPTGRTVALDYDSYSPNPLSRNNLRHELETTGPAGIDGQATTRSRAWSHEPLFNQVLVATDVYGRETRFTYDYQELGSADAEALLFQLRFWGLPPSTPMSQYAPRLTFGGDVNGDGAVGQVRGDLVKIEYPDATLASGARQHAAETFRYNLFSQLIEHVVAGKEPVTFAYYPAITPTGAAVARADAYLLSSQRAAASVTGGLERAVSTRLIQDVAGPGLAGLTATTVVRSTEYDLVGRAIRQVNVDGTVERREIDGLDRVVREIDGAGFETLYQHDPVGRVTMVVEGIAAGQLALHGGPPARRTLRAWSPGGHLLGDCVERVEGACGDGTLTAMIASRASGAAAEVTTHRYDAEGHRVSTTNAESHEAIVERDERGLPRRTTVGDGLETEYFIYDEAGQLEARSNELDERTTYEYDGFDRLVAVTDPVGTTWRLRLGRDDEQLETQAIDASGRVLESTTQAYDERGRVFEVRRAWSTPAGQLAQPGQTSEVVTRVELDIDGRPVAITDPLGQVTHRDYNSLGGLEAETSPGGDRVLTYHELSSRLIRVRAVGLGHDLHGDTWLDGRGRVIATTALDGANVVARERAKLDAFGNTLERTDAQGNVATWTYDLAGRMIASREPSLEGGPADRTTTYERDRLGQVTRMVDTAGVETVRTWTPAGHLGAEVAGRQRKAHYYDAAGRWRGVVTDRNDQVSVTRVNGQVTRVDGYSPIDGYQVRTFSRDGLGRPTWAVSYGVAAGVTAIHVTRRTYDSLGRMREEGTQLYRAGATWLDPIPNSEHVVRSAWDANGGLATLQYPDGTRVETVRDPDGKPIDLSWDGGDGHASLAWEGGVQVGEDIDRQGSWLLGGAVKRDAVGRVIGLEAAGVQGRLFAEHRALDPMGRVREQSQTWDGASRTRAFEYDGAGALAAAWSTPTAMAVVPLGSNADVASAGAARWGATRRTFERDRTGTLLAERTGTVTHYEARAASPERHELAAILAPAGVAIVHDALGQVSTDGRSDFLWNALGELRSATDRATAVRTDYVYDAFGRRVAKVSGGVTEEFVWAGWNRIATLRNGAVTGRTVFGPGWDHPIEVDVQGVAYFPIRDIQGSVVATTDAAGAVVENYQYDAYGNLTILDADGSVRCEDAPARTCQPIVEHGYTGQLRDAETGLYYFKNRYYSPALRTFLSRDPLGDVDGPDAWQYVAGDPINAIDPAGTETMTSARGRAMERRGSAPQTFAEELGLSRGAVRWLREKANIAGDANDSMGVAVAPFAILQPKTPFGDLSNATSVAGIALGVIGVMTAETGDELIDASLDTVMSAVGLFGPIGTGVSAGYTVGKRLILGHIEKQNRAFRAYLAREERRIGVELDELLERQRIEEGRLDAYLKSLEAGQQAVKVAREQTRPPPPKGSQPHARGGSPPRSSMAH